MEEQLLAFLGADAGVVAIQDDRISWAARPQAALLPLTVLHRITGARDDHMLGRSGLVESLVQIDCWGRTWLEAKQLARAHVAALDGLKPRHSSGPSWSANSTVSSRAPGRRRTGRAATSTGPRSPCASGTQTRSDPSPSQPESPGWPPFHPPWASGFARPEMEPTP